MNYQHEFSCLRVAVADCSAELRAFVEQLAHAPIWDDRAACLLIADWSEWLEAAHAEYFPIAHVEQMRAAALAELRGEDVRRLETVRMIAQAQDPIRDGAAEQLPLLGGGSPKR